MLQKAMSANLLPLPELVWRDTVGDLGRQVGVTLYKRGCCLYCNAWLAALAR